MIGYIYITTNLINGKKYIGQKRSTEFNPEYKGSGKYLWRAINKYGWDNFKVELVKECNTNYDDLDQMEIDLIKQHDAVNSKEFYNLQAGGQKGNIKGSKLSDETRALMSSSRKGRHTGVNNVNYNRTKIHKDNTHKLVKNEDLQWYLDNGWELGISDERRKFLSEKIKKYNPMTGHQLRGKDHPYYGKKSPTSGMKMSEEFCKHVSESRKGDKNPGFNKKWIYKGEVSKRVLEEDLEYYINDGWRLGRYVSQETRNKHREIALKRERGEHNGRFL